MLEERERKRGKAVFECVVWVSDFQILAHF